MVLNDGTAKIATKEECKAAWGGVPNGARFKCSLCDHKFVVGDKWRWYGSSKHKSDYGGILVCETCDTDVLLANH